MGVGSNLFVLTEQIQDIIQGYNTIIVLADVTSEPLDTGSNTVCCDDQDILIFKKGRITVKSETFISIGLRCAGYKVNELDKVINELNSEQKSNYIGQATNGPDYICSLELANDNQDSILEDIRNLLSCIV